MSVSDLSPLEVRRFIQRILQSRTRLLCNHGFYGLLLMHVSFSLTDETSTACACGCSIAFSPSFLEQLSDSELDFVMMHEVLHIALGHCWRSYDLEPERSNIAADIVVNSNILKSNDMDLASVTISSWGGPSMHVAPDGREGYLFTMEELYELIPSPTGKSVRGAGSLGSVGPSGSCSDTWDDHQKFGKKAEGGAHHKDEWQQYVLDACEAIKRREETDAAGSIPMFAQRMLEELKYPQLDWRMILNEFVQEEIADYSFSPPDRRFDESPFFLPDFNSPVDRAERLLFMIDTSGSMTDELVTEAYSEIVAAVDQFNGGLQGWLGFFDAVAIEPRPFESEESLKLIRPQGGGGTSFEIIFDYVENNMMDDPPASIIILTDGYALFPAKERAMGIPVLWLINNNKVDPPWGKVARIRGGD